MKSPHAARGLVATLFQIGKATSACLWRRSDTSGNMTVLSGPPFDRMGASKHSVVRVLFFPNPGTRRRPTMISQARASKKLLFASTVLAGRGGLRRRGERRGHGPAECDGPVAHRAGSYGRRADGQRGGRSHLLAADDAAVRGGRRGLEQHQRGGGHRLHPAPLPGRHGRADHRQHGAGPSAAWHYDHRQRRVRHLRQRSGRSAQLLHRQRRLRRGGRGGPLSAA